jgi:hypothetical protein
VASAIKDKSTSKSTIRRMANPPLTLRVNFRPSSRHASVALLDNEFMCE